MMKKSTTLILATCILFSSCVSTTSQSGYLGTMAGAEIGGTIGEAIGWMSTSRHEGPGKAMLGSIIGTVAGAVIGHELATQAEKNQEKKRQERRDRQHERNNRDYQTEGGYTLEHPNNQLSISNLNYQDEDGDGRFSRYETINIIFDVRNYGNTDATVTLSIDDPYHIKEIAFSPSNVATIHPGQIIRYKAKAFCKSRIKENYVNIICSASSPTAGMDTETLRIRTGE